MSFLIDTMYSQLGLTDAEKATVNTALPSFKDVLDTLDAHLADVTTIQQLVAHNPTLLKQLLTDWAVIGPNLSAATTEDGSVDMFAILGAYNDIKAHIAANPRTVAAGTALYKKLLPVIDQMIADWPKIKPAIAVMMTAAHRGHVSMQDMMTHLHAEAMFPGG